MSYTLAVRIAALTLVAALIPTTVLAKPDFSQSTVTAQPAAVMAGDVVTYTVVLRNSGDADATHTEVALGLPLEALFAGPVDAGGLTVDSLAKVIIGTVNLPAGGERRFAVRMVVPRDAGGKVLKADLRMRFYYLQAEHDTGLDLIVETRPNTSGLRVGPIRFNTPSLVLLGVLALYPLLKLLVGSRVDGHGPIVAIVLSSGFLAMFGGLAWHDWQTLREWRDASCTVLDTRLRTETMRSSIEQVQGARRSMRGEVTTLEPLLALRYSAAAADVISTGYDTGTRIQIGRGEAIVEEYARWKVGSTVPCWFNPRDPGEVVVIRGFGGAYLFALIPLPLFVYGVTAIAKRRGRGTAR